MELKGKKALFLGDSITYGAGTSDPDKFGFVSVFAELSGCECKNYGVCASRIAHQIKTDPYDYDFIVRAAEMDDEADIVVVFGGTNDFGHGDAPLGSFDSRDPYTFYGACHTLYSYLIEHYPTSTIVVLTPLHRLSEDVTVNEIGVPCHPLIDYVRAEREVAEYYSLPVLDLFAASGLQPKVPVILERFMPDGLHPNDAGAKRIAERLYGFLYAI